MKETRRVIPTRLFSPKNSSSLLFVFCRKLYISLNLTKNISFPSPFVLIKQVRLSSASRKFRRMRRAIMFALLLFFPAFLHARVIKWEGKPIPVSISTERLTRIEFPETLRSVFLSHHDIAAEKEDRSLLRPGAGAGSRRYSLRCRRNRDDIRDKSFHLR